MNKILFSSLLCIAALSTRVSAQPVFSDIFPAEEFAARRAEIMEQIGVGCHPARHDRAARRAAVSPKQSLLLSVWGGGASGDSGLGWKDQALHTISIRGSGSTRADVRFGDGPWRSSGESNRTRCRFAARGFRDCVITASKRGPDNLHAVSPGGPR